MNTKIDQQLQLIEKSVNWVKETASMRGAKGENAHRSLIDFRRNLNKKKFALEGNPAAAVYGESQMGKSYLVASLLSENGKPFNIIDGQGNKYDFITQINPIGKGAESTSLVTRFSTDYEWKNPKFPVMARLLTPADIILVLCDSYYNDVKAKIDIAKKSETISEEVLSIFDKYNNKFVQQNLLVEDDILDIYDYFVSNFSTKATTVIHSVFFDKIPLIIDKVHPEEWCDVFSLLWNKNPFINEIFSELIKCYSLLNFSKEVYLPIDAILRDKGTVLDVARLHEIKGRHGGSEPDFRPDTEVLTFNNGQEKIVGNFSKSYICALTAELILQLPKESEKSKEFLCNTDLLDFPGARHRLGIHEEDIDAETIPNMLLRGKVAFLFNKYSNSEKINILLFCHSDRQSAQSIMPEMLDKWICDMIGKTSEDRNKFILTSKVPPLFVVSTMFNLDLQFDYNNDREGNRSYMNSRWEKRFVKVLKREIFGTETYNWLTDFTTDKKNFQNIYLLRDFYYSSETNSKIYEGYNENKIELKEIVPTNYADFRRDLRTSFVEYEFVRQHFENPENSWDRVASINEDGTKLIIDKLTVAADNINVARHEKTVRELNEITEKLIAFLSNYYNSSDKADSLLKAISIAGDIQANLDVAFGRNPYFFGNMMNEFMISNSDVFVLYLEKIRDIERRDVVDMDKYSAIRMNVPELDPCESFETNLEYLRRHYEKNSAKECQHFFENNMKIDLNELFYGNVERVKNFSQVLAESLESYWFDVHMLKNCKNLSEIFSEEGFLNIRDMLHKLFKKLQVSKIISEKIHRYVDGFRNIEDAYEMVADISSEMINKFINSVGFDYYNDSIIADLVKASENINGLSWEHKDLQFNQNCLSEVVDLIDKIDNLSDLLNQNPLPKSAKRLPNYRSYIMWYDLLKAGFVTSSGVPDYDPIANEKLGNIISDCKTIKY